MRNFYILIIIIILFYPARTAAQVNIEKLPGIDGGSFTTVVEFQDTLYTISHSGEVFHSADVGSSWNKDPRFNLGWTTAFEVDQSAYLAVDESRNQMYVSGSFGLMIYGEGTVRNPEELPSFFGSRGTLSEVVVSDSALYISYFYTTSTRGEIFKSTDGGTTWSSHDATNQFFDKLKSTADGRLLGMEGNDLYLSEPGGTSFTQLPVESVFLDKITDVLVAGDTIYFSSFELGTQSSTDNGQTWTQVHPETALSLNQLSDGTILAGGLNGHVYLSSDNGATWSDTDLEYLTSAFNYHGISSVVESGGNLIATTMWGDAYNNRYEFAAAGIISSTDNGASWNPTNTGLSAVSLVQLFHDEANDDIYTFVHGTGVYRLDNASSSWVSVGTPADLNDDETFLAVSPDWTPVGEAIQLARDTGTGNLAVVSRYVTLLLNEANDTWEAVTHDPYEFLRPRGLFFNTDGTAIVHESLGPFQGLYTSTDLATWTEVEIPFNSTNISQFSASDDHLVYFDNYAPDGTVGTHYSSDDGVSWTYVQADREGFFLVGGYFHDKAKGDIITALSSYPEPTFQLTSTIEIYDMASSEYSEIEFSAGEEFQNAMMMQPYRLPNGALFGFVNAENERSESVPTGYFYQSEDSWVLVEGLPEGAADEVIITGDNRALFRYGAEMFSAEFAAASTSSEFNESSTPSAFTLLPNYPNPFNPSTNINFELAESANTSITVYSSLGQVVREINPGRLSAGSHTVQFDASMLSSGIYLYSVQVGNQVRTGKMTLIK